MQVNTANLQKKIDTRTFDQIYHTFSKIERVYFQEKLKKEKIPIHSMYRWFKGMSPTPATRKTLMDILKGMDIITKEDCLFPQITRKRTYGRTGKGSTGAEGNS